MHPTPSPREDPSRASGLTPNQAQQRLDEVIARIDRALPQAGRVKRIDARGGGLSCSELSEQRTGGFTITYDNPLDADTVFAMIRREFDDGSGWEFTRRKSILGEPRLSMGNAYGEYAILDLIDRVTAVDMASFSPCYLSPPWPPE